MIRCCISFILLFLFLFQEVDFSTHPFIPKDARLLVDITTFVLQENYILLSPFPEEESRLSAVIRPFNSMVRIVIGLYLVNY